MKNHSFGLCAALVSLAFNAPVAAQDGPVELAPARPWVLDYAQQSCALQREFGQPNQLIAIELRQTLPGQYFVLLVGSPHYAPTGEVPELTFLPDEGVKRAIFRSVRGPNGFVGFTAITDMRPARDDAPIVVASLQELRERTDEVGGEVDVVDVQRGQWLDENRDAREAAITGLRISQFFEMPIVLHTGSMHEAMNALRGCLDDLLLTRGVDPETTRGPLAQPARPLNQVSWLGRIAEYPSAAIRAGIEGRVELFVLIDTEGRVSDCTVLEEPGGDLLGQSACARMVRFARFRPALDGNGEPTIGFWQTNVVFQLQ